MKTNPNKLWIIVFALGWFFDFLFWEKAPGVNFAIFSMACLTAAFYLLLSDGLRPNRMQPEPAAALWLFRRCHIHPRRADDHLPRLHLHPVDHVHPCLHLPWRTLVSYTRSWITLANTSTVGQHDRTPHHLYDRCPQGTKRGGRSTLEKEYLACGARHCHCPAHHRHLRLPARLRRCGLRPATG
jgi:hypothetical protein